MSHTNVGFCNCAECAHNRGAIAGTMSSLTGENALLRKALIRSHSIIDTLIDAMEEVRELIAGYVDIKDDEAGYAMANDAMRADQLLEVVIAKAKRARGAK